LKALKRIEGPASSEWSPSSRRCESARSWTGTPVSYFVVTYNTVYYTKDMPHTAGPPQVRAQIETSESSVDLVAYAFRRRKGLTVGQIASILARPWPITAEWLTLMERGGLVRRSSQWNGEGGTPIRIYRASPMFRRAASGSSSEPPGTVSFDRLREICKFQIDGCCTTSPDHRPCTNSNCPYLGLDAVVGSLND